MILRALLTTTVVLLALPAAAEQRSRAQAVVYDGDDRAEAHTFDDTIWGPLARETVVAVVPWSRLQPTETGYALDARTLRETLGVCSTTAFASQPSLANCTGTLIADDLVLTAGHCVPSPADCERHALVFGYALDADGTLPELDAEQVFACDELVVWEERNAERWTIDHAVVRLDRPATPAFTPATLRVDDEPLPVDTPLTLIGFPNGVPAKVVPAGAVADDRARARDYFVARTDAFEGNSGGGLFLDDGTLVGVLARGLEDYVQDGSCLVPRTLPGSAAGEEVQPVIVTLRALCEADPSASVCQGFACADPAACESTRAAPEAWTCPLVLYDDGAGCDCGCGAPDPDCALDVTEFSCAAPLRCLDAVCVTEQEYQRGREGDDSGCAAAPVPAAGWWFYPIISWVMRRAKRAGSSRGVPSSSSA